MRWGGGGGAKELSKGRPRTMRKRWEWANTMAKGLNTDQPTEQLQKPFPGHYHKAHGITVITIWKSIQKVPYFNYLKNV